MHVSLIRAWPGRFDEVTVQMLPGATVGDALRASGWNVTDSDAAVFGVLVTPDTLLNDGDRVELLRPLVADPKQARRVRADARRERTAPATR